MPGRAALLMDVVTVAIAMGLLPLASLVVLHLRGERRDVAWWWLGVAFAVSWLADVVANALPAAYRWGPSVIYPVTQSAIIGAVLLPRQWALWFLALMTTLAAIVLAWVGVGPDVLVRSVAWLALGVMANRIPIPFRLRLSLSVYFGLGLLAWFVHMRFLVVETWYPYQLARLAGLMLFGWAALEPTPSLRIVPRRYSPLTVRI